MCPNDALFIPGFSKTQIDAQIKAIIEEKKEYPYIIAFLCNWCSYAGADIAGVSKIQYPSNIRPIRVMCTAMLDPSLVFESFFHGADGVLIAGCYPQDCHYDTGFIKASTRYESIREMLAEAGINEKRVRIESVSAGEGEKFSRIVSEFKDQIEKLGPIKPNEYVRKTPQERKEKEKARLDEI